MRMEDGTAKVVSTQAEVERSIWQVIHDKRFHLAERAPICKGRLRGQFGYMGNTTAAAQVLDGFYEYEDGMHQGTADLLKECAKIRTIIPENSVETMISGKEWAEAYGGERKRKPHHQNPGCTSDTTSQHHHHSWYLITML